jgi:hypothetical protein
VGAPTLFRSPLAIGHRKSEVLLTWTISAPSSFCLENPGTRWFVLLAKTGR